MGCVRCCGVPVMGGGGVGGWLWTRLVRRVGSVGVGWVGVGLWGCPGGVGGCLVGVVGGVVVVVAVAGSSGLFEVVDDGGDERGECVGGETERAAGLFVEAAVVFDHGVDSFDGVASGVVGGPVGGSVGVALVVVELFDAEGDHSVAAVLGVGDGDGGLVGVVGAVGPVGVAGFGGGHNAARALGADEFLFSVGEVLDDYPLVFVPFVVPVLEGAAG